MANTDQTDGDEVETKSYTDVRNTDVLVREYRTPPGDRLYAYREGNEHVIVSNGSEPATRWEKRVPAERERVVPGQKLWTIPSNWQKRVYSSRDSIAYGLYYIPESDVWVKLSIPTNDWLVDAWYKVQQVGSITVSPTRDVGDYSEWCDVLDEYEQMIMDEDLDDSQQEIILDVVRATRFNRAEVKEGVEAVCERLSNQGGWRYYDESSEYFRVDESWTYEEPNQQFRPDIDIKENSRIDEWTDSHRYTLGEIIQALRDENLLPNAYEVRLGIDESTLDMDYYIRALEEWGCSPAETLDYYYVEIEGQTQTDRAETRGVRQSSVSENVSEARTELNI